MRRDIKLLSFAMKERVSRSKMKSQKSDGTSSHEEQVQEDRRETILQRRDRVLGTKSLTYVKKAEKGPLMLTGGNKRKGQILQAQRTHRQRTLGYMTELENEVFRLRESEAALTCTVQDKDKELRESARAEKGETISIHSLIQCFNGQVAPGLWIKVERLPDIEKRIPPPHESLLDIAIESLMDPNLYRSIEWHPSPFSPCLEKHDALTRMLLLNFSGNIAPTLVAFDGISNGYRSLLLPFAWEDDLVRCALLASSANHLRFRRPKLTNLALSLQSAAIEKLACLSKCGNHVGTARSAILAAIVLLIINGMMNGGNDFELLLNMAKSWIEAMSDNGGLKQAPESTLDEFLLDQIIMLQLYALPLLKEQVIILSQYDCYSPDSLAGNFSFGSRMCQIFSLLEDAIKQACAIFTYNILTGSPPSDIEDMLETLKNTVAGIPNHTPGENALAWVYFIAAAESTRAAKRTFFAKRLMGIYERGHFSDVTSAFKLLHDIWGFQGTDHCWTKVLMQMPIAMR